LDLVLGGHTLDGMRRYTRSANLPGGTGIRVLVVDDYPDNVESMALLLRLCGYKVDVARTGQAALLAAQVHPPDVVLCDVSMPGISGLEVARRLRQMLQDSVLLVAITAHGFDEDRGRCIEAGFDRCFVKPADPEKIKGLLREVEHAV
jgi:CheY-like chemotaxis protein